MQLSALPGSPMTRLFEFVLYHGKQHTRVRKWELLHKDADPEMCPLGLGQIPTKAVSQTTLVIRPYCVEYLQKLGGVAAGNVLFQMPVFATVEYNVTQVGVQVDSPTPLADEDAIPFVNFASARGTYAILRLVLLIPYFSAPTALAPPPLVPLVSELSTAIALAALPLVSFGVRSTTLGAAGTVSRPIVSFVSESSAVRALATAPLVPLISELSTVFALTGRPFMSPRARNATYSA